MGTMRCRGWSTPLGDNYFIDGEKQAAGQDQRRFSKEFKADAVALDLDGDRRNIAQTPINVRNCQRGYRYNTPNGRRVPPNLTPEQGKGKVSLFAQNSFTLCSKTIYSSWPLHAPHP